MCNIRTTGSRSAPTGSRFWLRQAHGGIGFVSKNHRLEKPDRETALAAGAGDRYYGIVAQWPSGRNPQNPHLFVTLRHANPGYTSLSPRFGNA
jgi:hypothetical protein